MSELLDLPNELLIYTLSFLNWQELACALRVNKRIQSVASDEALWKPLFAEQEAAALKMRHVKPMHQRAIEGMRGIQMNGLSTGKQLNLKCSSPSLSIDAQTVAFQGTILYLEQDPQRKDTLLLRREGVKEPLWRLYAPKANAVGFVALGGRVVVALSHERGVSIYHSQNGRDFSIVKRSSSESERRHRYGWREGDVSFSVEVADHNLIAYENNRFAFASPLLPEDSRAVYQLSGDGWLSSGGTDGPWQLSRIGHRKPKAGGDARDSYSIPERAGFSFEATPIAPDVLAFAVVDADWNLDIVAFGTPNPNSDSTLESHRLFKSFCAYHERPRPASFLIGRDHYVAVVDSGMTNEFARQPDIHISSLLIVKNPPKQLDDPPGTKALHIEHIEHTETRAHCVQLFDHLGTLFAMVVDDQQVRWYDVEKQEQLGEQPIPKSMKPYKPLSIRRVGPLGSASFLVVSKSKGKRSTHLFAFNAPQESAAKKPSGDSSQSSEESSEEDIASEEPSLPQKPPETTRQTPALAAALAASGLALLVLGRFVQKRWSVPVAR